MKLISFAVPCYNSEAYMRRCVESLLTGGSKVEIILVNDGSTDRTGAIADEYQAKFPHIVKAIHKENGGHGSGIMAGLQAAEGIYYKVVDSDDWVNPESLQKVLNLIETFLKCGNPLDLIVCNYVYEHEGKRPHTVHYHGILPRNRQFGWEACGHFDMTRYIIMHSVLYRTDLVRRSNLQIPLHTFYVDNLFLYSPLPLVNTIYYCDTDLYRYYIGRSDQSVSEANMIKRVDQQLLVTKLILKKHDLRAIRASRPKLFHYMFNYACMMVLIASLFLSLDGSPEALKKLEAFWQYIKEEHPYLYPYIKKRSLAGFYSTTNKYARAFTTRAYRIIRKIYKFN